MVKKTKKKGKEINWIIGWLVGLFVLYLILSTLFGRLGTFTYEGLVFTKERLGELDIYHHSYYYESKNGGVNQYNLYLRNDPRENNILVDGELGFDLGKMIYISINGSELETCEDSGIALAALSSFFTDNEFMVKGASWDKAEAQANDVRYITCENRPSNPVLLFKKGVNASIVVENQCHTLTVGCEDIVKVVEKFEVQTILDAKTRTT